MKIQLATACLIVGSLLAPVAAHATDADSDRTHPMIFAKDSVITTKIKARLAAEKVKSLMYIKVDTDSMGLVVLQRQSQIPGPSQQGRLHCAWH